jgi:septal ring factor EnvC (AmiA/AmiB activator)
VLALVEPGSVSDAVHRRIVLAQVLPVIMNRTRNLRTELARSDDLRRGAEVATSSLAKTRDNLTAQRTTLAMLEQRQRLAARQLRDTAGIENERALAMGEQARDIGDLLTQVEAAGSVREKLLSLPGPTLRPATPGATALPTNAVFTAQDGARPPAYSLPVIGEVVTGFGELTPEGVRARGLTIATAPAAAVVAPAAGRIAFAGPFQGYGRILIIEHGNGWTSLVANLDHLSAQVGDEVRLGDPVGSAGPGQPRVTVELRQGEQPVDIVAILR